MTVKAVRKRSGCWSRAVFITKEKFTWILFRAARVRVEASWKITDLRVSHLKLLAVKDHETGDEVDTR